MNTLPSEIIQHILITLSYEDIISYCSINLVFQNVCNDKIFWLLLLDRDFTKYTQIGIFIPSKYVTLYGPKSEPGQTTYKRWLTHQISNITEIKFDDILNLDIIKWTLDTYGINESELAKIKIQLYSAININNIRTLDFWAARGIYPNQSMILLGIKYDIIIDWLLQHEIYPNANTIIQLSNGKHNPIRVLTKLAEYGILPNNEAANYATITDNYNLLEWLLQHDIFPDHTSIEQAILHKNTIILKLLASYKLLPLSNQLIL